MPNSISDNLQRLQTARTDIAEAITAKGGIVGSNDGFEEFVNDINSIPTGGGSSFVLDNVKCKPSLKGELKDFPVWIASDITSENLSSGYETLLIYGQHIWTDGDNIYSSYINSGTTVTKVEYNESLNMWITRPGVSWNKGILGNMIWTDGENVYYTRYYSGSYDEKYVLDKTTNSWVSKTWNFSGSSQPTSWFGMDVWTDGMDIYLSTSSGSFVLDKSTSTWVSKSWNVNIADGRYIWTDGDNIYHWVTSSTAYVLDTDTSTWNSFSTNISINGTTVWTDGNFIYSDYSVYNKTTKRIYSLKDSWTSSFNGSNVWTDGENIYCGLSISSTIDAKVNKLVTNKNEVSITGVSVPNNIPFK